MTAVRNKIQNLPDAADIRSWLADVPDPEIPILSIIDLGMVRDVTVTGDCVTVFVAPTYSGCPATEVIENSISEYLLAKGVASVRIQRQLSPPWTTDWISDCGRAKLLAYGIAPPEGSAGKPNLFAERPALACPRCSSLETTLVSEFGSTACKASYKCRACLEPFEYFKCI
jgi:ring-1,2-phenylacetyl-CoA epoxidase subunit PaaD